MHNSQQHNNASFFISFIFPVSITLIIILGFTSAVNATIANADDAQQVCENWLTLNVMKKGSWAGSTDPKISNIVEVSLNDTVLARCYYISPSGYVIVPVLEEMPPVKMSSETSTIDFNKEDGISRLIKDVLIDKYRIFVELYGSPDAVKPLDNVSYLGVTHKGQWEQYKKSGDEFAVALTNKSIKSTDDVGPLLTTTWHQTDPYNLLCPAGDGGTSAVGCVATAAAQIMAYWQYPIAGNGTKTYWWDGDNSCGGSTPGDSLTADYLDPYDWDNMIDDCTSSSTAAEKAAVSELCYEVGVALSTDYGRCGSGASVIALETVLPHYFYYENSMYHRSHFYYSATEWFAMIQAEIDNGRPIQYAIKNHSIVCDGWRVSGDLNQYHINYGWDDEHTTWYTVDEIYCNWEGCGPSAELAVFGIQPRLQKKWYVATDGDDVYGSGTINDPFETLQHAVDNAYMNDTIVIKTGTYSEDVLITKNVIIIGEDKVNTIFEHSAFSVNSYPAITGEMSNLTLCDTSSIDLFVDSADWKVTDCIFYNNSTLTTVGCDATFERNLFYENHLAIYASSGCDIILYNNTFCSNDSSIAIHTDASGVDIQNNIFTSNSWSITLPSNFYAITNDYNLIWNNDNTDPDYTPGPNDMNADPDFIDGDPFNFHLKCCSPAVDAGNPSLALDSDGTVSDIGAYYYDQSAMTYCENIWHVSETGNDGSGDGSESNPFGTIQYAVDFACSGDTVKILPGTYNENIVCTKSLSLVGEGEESKIIGTRFLGPTIDINNSSEATYGQISNLYINGSNREIGVRISSDDSSKWIVSNNHIDSTSYGILIYKDSVLVKENIISSNTTGIGCTGGSNAQVFNNTIYNCDKGINVLSASENNNVQNNIITECSFGIVISTSYTGTTTNDYNIFWLNGTDYDNCTPGSNDFNANPQLIGGDPFDYHLQCISPCIDAGNPSFDLDPDGTRCDIGAYPLYQLLPCVDSDNDCFGDPGHPENNCPQDNCPDVYNPDQEDTDGDGVGDACDICAGYDDALDDDSDGVPNGCDICAGYDDALDDDSDGVPNGCDICAGYDDTLDDDSDGVPNGCDICAGYDDTLDDDSDGVPNGCDICAGYDDTLDDDSDGVPNGCDLCAGYDDALDDDSDGVPDGCDICAGYDDNQNSDSDTIPDGCDNCPGVSNTNQINSDSDSYGDACDNCPDVTNEDQVNSDSDSYGDICDNCPYVTNEDQTDSDGNNIGDACEGCCIGYTGNANCSGDEIPDISDITRLIDYLYLSHDELCCPEEADANGSGDEPDISDITRLIDYLYLSHDTLVDCP